MALFEVKNKWRVFAEQEVLDQIEREHWAGSPQSSKQILETKLNNWVDFCTFNHLPDGNQIDFVDILAVELLIRHDVLAGDAAMAAVKHVEKHGRIVSKMARETKRCVSNLLYMLRPALHLTKDEYRVWLSENKQWLKTLNEKDRKLLQKCLLMVSQKGSQLEASNSVSITLRRNMRDLEANEEELKRKATFCQGVLSKVR